jgi:predicted RNase H-like nuclease
MFIGLDGFRRGWVAVRLHKDGARDIRFLPELRGILDWPLARAMIDLPIGLPDADNRGCDEAARAVIAPHRSRVFLGARRWILDCGSPADANREARRREQKGVSVQLFGLRAKMAEADLLVQSNGQERLCETHPELVFRRLNGGRPLAAKKTAEGHALRRRLLEADGFDALDAWLESRRGTGAKADDVFDACAVAARDSRDRVPARNPRRDALGLRMEIHF